MIDRQPIQDPMILGEAGGDQERVDEVVGGIQRLKTALLDVPEYTRKAAEYLQRPHFDAINFRPTITFKIGDAEYEVMHTVEDGSPASAWLKRRREAFTVTRRIRDEIGVVSSNRIDLSTNAFNSPSGERVVNAQARSFTEERDRKDLPQQLNPVALMNETLPELFPPQE